MKHYGDITKIHGSDVEPVNVIIGGSPCQDLSVAGKRAGLAGERSGLFMEQLRIIKEMRAIDEAIRGRKGSEIRPRFMVWENVPGAFSSNKGADFGAVLQETARVIVQKAPAIPIPKKGWPTSGCLYGMGDGGGPFSIAWRVFDAQFWGVPQRRRRISLVADFGGLSAPEILFEREGVPGDTTQSAEAWKDTPAYAQTGTKRDDPVLGGDRRFYDVRISSDGTKNWRAHCYETDISRSLDTAEPNPDSNHGGVAVVEGCLNPWDIQSKRVVSENGVADPLYAGECRYGGGKAYVMQSVGDEATQKTYCIQGNCIDRSDTAGCNGKGWAEDKAYTLNTIDRPTVTQAIPVENHPNDSRVKLSEDGIVQTLSGRMGTGGGNTPIVLECYSQDAYDKYTPNDKSATIKNTGGVYGGDRKY